MSLERAGKTTGNINEVLIGASSPKNILLDDGSDEPKNFLGMQLPRYNYPQKVHYV